MEFNMDDENVNEELRKYIGKKIKEYRLKRNLTQEYMGEKLGVKNNTFSAYERGTSSPNSDQLFIIGQLLDVKVDEFFPSVLEEDVMDKIKDYGSQKISVEQMHFFQQLVEKTLSLSEEERAKFLEGIQTIVELYDKMKK